MQTDSCRHWGVIKALTPTLRSAVTIPAVQHGYTLVELLVGVALGSVVMSSLGVVLMLSEVKVSEKIQRNLDTKDAVNRATDLMRREATFSNYIAEGGVPKVGESPLDNCVSATRIRYPQRNNASDICYKSVAPADLPAVYQALYKGPCVIVRLGPPYRPNGDLDTSATPIAQVLLDGIAKSSSFCTSTTGFRVTIGSPDLATSIATPIRRNADMTITMASGASYRFSVRSPSNPAHDGNSLYDLCTTTSDLGCAQQTSQVTYHFKPFMNSMTEVGNGQPSKENLFYFKYPFSEYVLKKDSSSGTCTYSQCYVRRNDAAVQLSKVDGLIFSDQEIRVLDES